MCPEITQILYIFLTLVLQNSLSESQPLNLTKNNDGGHNDLTILEVPYGKTVTLICRSNDKDHNFLYWHLNGKNTVVGPGNDFDNHKFQYEVLSGNLTIKAVSKYEEGLYNCVSRGVKANDFNIRSVRMVVQRDWEEVYEHSSSINLFRIVLILGVFIVLGGIGFVGYQIWKSRYRHPHYLVPSDEEDEDSGDEIFRAPGTSYTPSESIIRSNFRDDIQNPEISTDFKSILDTANNK